MPQEPPTTELGPFQFVLLVLSLLLLATLAVDALLPLPVEVERLIDFIDTAMCVLFLADFVLRFARAESKLRFMRWGWIDLLASVPAIEALRWARLFRIVRIVRLLLEVRPPRRLRELLLASKARAGIASLLAFAFIIICFSSIAILLCETAEKSNIRTAGDALWWTFVTITTVGYGDVYPVTNAGRVVAVITMFAGVGIFGAMSGVMAAMLVGAHKHHDVIREEGQAVRDELAKLQPPAVPPNTNEKT